MTSAVSFVRQVHTARFMRLSIFVLCATLLGVGDLSLTLAAQQPQTHDKELEALDKQKEKLKRQNDPVDRTKADIKISDILLSLVNEAVKAGDIETMRERIREYSDTIEDARHAMMSTGRDAHKRPAGFKELEIALRGQIRQLDDIGGALTFDQREPLEKARSQAVEIREELLKALFGSQNVAPHQP